MAFQAINDQIFNLLSAVDNIGMVHNRPRYSDDVQTIRELFIVGGDILKATFESDADGFSSTGSPDTAERSQEQSHRDDFSYKIIKAADSFAGVTQNYSVTSGRKYRVECMVFVTAGSVSDVQLKIDTNNAGFTDVDLSPTALNTWTNLRTEVSQAATTGTDKVQLLVKNGATAYFDDVRIIEWDGTNEVFHTWFPERVAVPNEATLGNQRRKSHQFDLWGYYQIDDSASSEHTFQVEIDTVTDLFDTEITLKDEADIIQAAELLEKVDVKFCGVLCHRAQIRIIVEEEDP